MRPATTESTETTNPASNWCCIFSKSNAFKATAILLNIAIVGLAVYDMQQNGDYKLVDILIGFGATIAAYSNVAAWLNDNDRRASAETQPLLAPSPV